MAAESIIEEIAERTGWNTESMLSLALDYIDNQCSDDAWADFLERAADEESDDPVLPVQKVCPKCGASGGALVAEGDESSPIVTVDCADCGHEWREPREVECHICGQDCRADTAHFHQGGWVGDVCCWDERLRSTE